MMSPKEHIHHKTSFLFTIGCLIGIAYFLFLFGTSVLDVTNVEWLYGDDRKLDLAQHYFGWAFFRTSDWMFPIGCHDALSYPLTSSIIYTDSIPLFAIVFKIFRGLLPEHFQYFGWFGLIVYALQGGMAAILIRKVLNDNSRLGTAYTLIGTCFFIIATPLFHRIFMHTSLASQFILLWMLYLLADNHAPSKPWHAILIWSLIMLLAVAIHFYFVPMVGLCMIFYIFRISQSLHNKSLLLPIFTIPMLVGIMATGLLGGFGSTTNTLNSIESNQVYLSCASAPLDSFFNTLGKVSPSLLPHPWTKTFAALQHEGFAYLGYGIIIGIILLGIFLIVRRKALSIWCKQEDYASERKFFITLTILATVFFLLSLSNRITLGHHSITIPLPNIVLRLWSIFRSTGRFSWMAHYIVILFLVVGLWRIVRNKRVAIGILSALLVIQCLDLLPWQLHDAQWKIARTEYSEQERRDLVDITQDKELICFSHYIYMMEGYGHLLQAANDRGLKLNAYYFAREDADFVDSYCRFTDSAMCTPSPECLFVLGNGIPDSASVLYPMLDFHSIGDLTLATAKK